MRTTAEDSLLTPVLDITKGAWLPGIAPKPGQFMTTIPAQLLLQLVPDPQRAESPRELKRDPSLAPYAELRQQVQRAVQGEKLKNARRYADYILEGLRGRAPLVLPPVTLYHMEELNLMDIGIGFMALAIPHGDYLVAIDGETQRIAWQLASAKSSAARRWPVKVVLYHGHPVEFARQAFYDLNVLEVKPSANLAIALNQTDYGTQVARQVAELSEVIGGRVNMKGRQLKKGHPDAITFSALRTGIAWTLLASNASKQAMSKPLAPMPEGTKEEKIKALVVDTWLEILERLAPEFEPERRYESVVSSPGIMAGLGLLANRTLPCPPRFEKTVGLDLDEMLERLDGVDWSKKHMRRGKPYSVWDGIAGRFSPLGTFQVFSANQAAAPVMHALLKPYGTHGLRIRGRKPRKLRVVKK